MHPEGAVAIAHEDVSGCGTVAVAAIKPPVSQPAVDVEVTVTIEVGDGDVA